MAMVNVVDIAASLGGSELSELA